MAVSERFLTENNEAACTGWYRVSIAFDLAKFIVKASDGVRALEETRGFCRVSFSRLGLDSGAFDEFNIVEHLIGKDADYYDRIAGTWQNGETIRLHEIAQANPPLNQAVSYAPPESKPIQLPDVSWSEY